MTELNVPWAAWYGTQPLAMRFPAGWQVDVHGNGDASIDDILDAFAVQSETPEGIAQQVVGRFGDIVDRTSCAYMSSSPEKEAALVAAFKTAA